MRYHFGSIAFGAFLIALVQFIRIIFEYYRKQMEKADKDNKVIKTILCLTSYLLDCLERFIKFISKNAYIQVSFFFYLTLITLDRSDRQKLLRRRLERLPLNHEERFKIRYSQLHRLHFQRPGCCLHHCSQCSGGICCPSLLPTIYRARKQLDSTMCCRRIPRVYYWNYVHECFQFFE